MSLMNKTASLPQTTPGWAEETTQSSGSLEPWQPDAGREVFLPKGDDLAGWGRGRAGSWEEVAFPR